MTVYFERNEKCINKFESTRMIARGFLTFLKIKNQSQSLESLISVWLYVVVVAVFV